MSRSFLFKGQQVGVGDKVKVIHKIKEKGKERLQSFEGIIIALKGKEEQKSITVRRIGVQQIGIERIFSLHSPLLQAIEVTRAGSLGVKRAKLYYLRKQSKKEIDKIYSRASRRS